ncbi:MAG: hypothetical protein ACKV2Q_31780 [Planctomycetaceae bacterium]
MKKAIQRYREAMDFADRAEAAQRRKAHEEAAQLFRQAFDCERAAAVLFVNDFDAEPTRSVLLRSAASLALECREYREAERLIAAALWGNPPVELYDELRSLLVELDSRIAISKSPIPRPNAKKPRTEIKRQPVAAFGDTAG